MTNNNNQYDAIVIGAGFSGLYMLHSLRNAGYKVKVFEAGDGVGGTWYWNRYPGARCDVESMYYNYTFSEEVFKEWTWSSRYPAQPEILEYLNFVADKFDLKKDIQFNTWVDAAHYDEETNKWHIYLKDGSKEIAHFFITGVGCLSASNIPDFKGLENFQGDYYHTGRWPHHQVDFTGKHVGVIGTGSSGIQAIPVIAEEADHVTVFQRTPQYTVPARNYPFDESITEKVKNSYHELKKSMAYSASGLPNPFTRESAIKDSDEERTKVYNDAWKNGGFAFPLSYGDLTFNAESNKTAAAFVRSKIREIVKDPETAEKLCPTNYYGTKRPILDTNYYETYNRENVSLVDVKSSPITEILPNGIRTEAGDFPVDTLVFATGYDGITGPLFRFDIRGKGGISLKEKWDDGANVETYLGIATSDFPNMFMLTGPESPSVLANMPIAIEQHVEWVLDCINYLNDHQIDVIEAEQSFEKAWSEHCSEVAHMTLYPQENSWYTGANIPGKARSFLIYVGGFDNYRYKCDEVASKHYEGFKLITKKEEIESR